MVRRELTIADLIESAKNFCAMEGRVFREELFGVTDGKAVGTFVERLFKSYLSERFELTIGNSAKGLDLPSINTDIKVTSIRQPQSSSPYKDSRQKIYGLGYNLLVFVYERETDILQKKGRLNFLSCTFIEAKRTADHKITTGLLNIIRNKGSVEDISAFLLEQDIPGDEVTMARLAEEVLTHPPVVGYLTISNALQWRLKYRRIVTMDEDIEGITPIVRYDGK